MEPSRGLPGNSRRQGVQPRNRLKTLPGDWGSLLSAVYLSIADHFENRTKILEVFSDAGPPARPDPVFPAVSRTWAGPAATRGVRGGAGSGEPVGRPARTARSSEAPLRPGDGWCATSFSRAGRVGRHTPARRRPLALPVPVQPPWLSRMRARCWLNSWWPPCAAQLSGNVCTLPSRRVGSAPHASNQSHSARWLCNAA